MILRHQCALIDHQTLLHYKSQLTLKTPPPSTTQCAKHYETSMKFETWKKFIRRIDEKKRKTLRMKKIINFRLEMTLTAWNYIKRSQTAEENENEGEKANKLIKKWTLKREWVSEREKENNFTLNILNRNLWMASSANIFVVPHDFSANKDATCWKLLSSRRKNAHFKRKSQGEERFLGGKKKRRSLSRRCCCWPGRLFWQISERKPQHVFHLFSFFFRVLAQRVLGSCISS